MAVNIERLGPNSGVITYGLTDTKAAIYPVMAGFIAQQGWEVHDNSAEYKTVFRAPMIDNPAVFKYVQVDWATNATKCLLNVFEEWDAQAHVGRNKAMLSNTDSHMQNMNVGVFGTVWIFASPRYLIMYSRMKSDTGTETVGSNGSYGYYSWVGAIEISKDNPAEVTGEYPRFALLSPGSASGNQAATTNGGLLRGYGLPRSIANTTTEVDILSPNGVGTLYGRASVGSSSVALLENVLPANANPFDLNTVFCSTLWALACFANGTTVKNHVRGRFYGAKVLALHTGSNLDMVKIPCDGDYFYLPEEDGGVLKDHLIIASGVNSSSNTGRWAIPL